MFSLLGEEGAGFNYIMEAFALERLVMGINAHARTEFALEYVLKYMEERKAFGKSLSEFQVLRHKVVDIEAELDVCKQYNYYVAGLLEDGQYAVKQATISKLKSTKMADEAI